MESWAKGAPSHGVCSRSPFKTSCGSCIGFALLCSGFSQKEQAVILLSRYL